MRLLRLNLVLAASAMVICGQLSAQDFASEPDVPAEPKDAPPEPPTELPRTLDDLIPQSAVENAADWAGRGVPKAPQQEDRSIIEEAPAQPIAPFDAEAALDTLAIPQPDPLERDEDLPRFADIDAPDLVELPDLIEVELSDELTLAFPAARSEFPEETEFVDRFRALSAIESLDSSEDTVPQLAARARSDEELLRNILRNYGYYGGDVVRQLSGGRRVSSDPSDEAREDEPDGSPKVRFDVLPGARYSFGAVRLGAVDELPEDEATALRSVFAIQTGDPLYSDRIVERAMALAFAMGERGYPFATIGEPNLLVDHAREEGDLTLPSDPGGQFTFGEVVSDDPAFLSSRHLQRIARFDPGDLYQASLQSDLRRAILATGLVSSVVITARETTPPQEGEPGEVTLDVALESAPLRTISGAIGFGTEDGLKVETAWEHRNLFPPEGALRLRSILGTREQLGSITYRRNNFRARDQVLTIDTFASAIETEAVDARTVALRASFERVSNLLFQKPLSWQLGAEVLYTDERNRVTSGVEPPRQAFLISGLFGSATLDASDDLLDPTSGYRATLFLAPESSQSEGVTSFYLRAQADASFYQDTGPAVIAGRVRVATIQGVDALEIAPSRRLYAGGGGSVRGYGFQAIGPRDEFDEPTGGGSLVEAAIEARIRTGFFDGALEVVPFLDIGSVSTGSTPGFEQIQYGAGLGVRYKTTFGPIRVDVGVPLNPTQFDAPVVVNVSLGQAF